MKREFQTSHVLKHAKKYVAQARLRINQDEVGCSPEICYAQKKCTSLSMKKVFSEKKIVFSEKK